jgi:hypothetical protein
VVREGPLKVLEYAWKAIRLYVSSEALDRGGFGKLSKCSKGLILDEENAVVVFEDIGTEHVPDSPVATFSFLIGLNI